jgi:hypothetical protein
VSSGAARVRMADDMTMLWKNFSLTEEEGVEVEIRSDVLEEAALKEQVCAIGKLLADRYVSKEIVRSAMIRFWKPTGYVSFKVLGTNIFLVEFEHEWDKVRIMEGRPWLFEGYVFSLACMCQKVGLQIGATLGEVEEVETNDEGFGWGEYLRVRVKLDLSKPIPRGRRLKLQGETIWVIFKYERLPRFCFLCGLVQHGERGCEKCRGPKNQEAAPQFGPWLRVPSPTR